MRAAALIVRSGPFAMQGEEAARGLRLWARLDGIDLDLVDDPSPESAEGVYHRWLREDRMDLVLGPYGSGLVRRVLPAVDGAGKVLWNHGGAADDLARPGAAAVAAPASTYLAGAVRLCARRGIGRLVILTGKGPFAAATAEGALAEARRLGIEAKPAPAGLRRPVDPGGAVLVTAGFQEDAAIVEWIRTGGEQPGLLGCVAAGVPQFGALLGSRAEGVVGPTQWVPGAAVPEIGPSGLRFLRLYEEEFGLTPGYVAAQAASAGFLASAARRLGMEKDGISTWRTSTLLGTFALDERWRQVGHSVSTIRWRQGRMERVPV